MNVPYLAFVSMVDILDQIERLKLENAALKSMLATYANEHEYGLHDPGCAIFDGELNCNCSRKRGQR